MEARRLLARNAAARVGLRPQLGARFGVGCAASDAPAAVFERVGEVAWPASLEEQRAASDLVSLLT